MCMCQSEVRVIVCVSLTDACLLREEGQHVRVDEVKLAGDGASISRDSKSREKTNLMTKFESSCIW